LTLKSWRCAAKKSEEHPVVKRTAILLLLAVGAVSWGQPGWAGEKKEQLERAPMARVEVAWPDRIVRGANLGEAATDADIAHFAEQWHGQALRILAESITARKPPYGVDPAVKAKFFRRIDTCLKHGLLTVFSPSASFDDNDKFFGNERWLAAYREFLREVAARYKDQGPIVYDLVNEPWGKEARRRWSSYAKELTAAIREVDPRHTIMVEPPEWGWPEGFQYLEPTGDRNTVYSFHFYGPMDFTHQRGKQGHMTTSEEQWRDRVYPGFMQGEKWDKQRLLKEVQTAAAWRDKHGARVWCGEFGVARWARGAYRWTADWIDLLEQEKIGWAYYEYRGWLPMDMEMDPQRREATPRGETDVVRLLRQWFDKKD
jgi:hypothetical protein